MNMVDATHTEAVTVLKNLKEKCSLVVSREVLVVMPDEPVEQDGEWQHEYPLIYLYMPVNICV